MRNPASLVDRYKEHARERFVSPDELKRVWTALSQEESPYWKSFFMLSLLLGTRKSELLNTRWSDLDIAQNADSSKNQIGPRLDDERRSDSGTRRQDDDHERAERVALK